MKTIGLALLATVAAAPLFAEDGHREMGAHVHGVSKLEMAVEGTLDACQHMVTQDPDERNRSKCMVWMERKGPDGGSQAMAHAAANDPSPKLRRKAIIIIGKRGWLDGRDAVMAATNDPDEAIVLEAWKAIIRLGDLEQRAQAHDAMLDANQSIKLRRSILKAIGENPLPQDVAPLIEALDDPDDEVAIQAAYALEKVGDSASAPVLREKAAARPDGKVKDKFNEAATALGG